MTLILCQFSVVVFFFVYSYKFCTNLRLFTNLIIKEVDNILQYCLFYPPTWFYIVIWRKIIFLFKGLSLSFMFTVYIDCSWNSTSFILTNFYKYFCNFKDNWSKNKNFSLMSSCICGFGSKWLFTYCVISIVLL